MFNQISKYRGLTKLTHEINLAAARSADTDMDTVIAPPAAQHCA